MNAGQRVLSTELDEREVVVVENRPTGSRVHEALI
jgi:hypothetical protein